MKRIRYMSMLMLLFCGINTWGQTGFNPDPPAEPNPAETRLVMHVSPSDAGHTSGSGRYVPKSAVAVRAYANTGFTFYQWTDSKGNIVSRDQYFTFAKGENADTLTAHFKFDPDNPADPDDPRYTLYYRLSLNTGEGGSVSGGGRYLIDTNVKLQAYSNTGFTFDGWYDSNGKLVSISNPLVYTMPGKATELTAMFKFNPDSPSEPKDPGLRPKHNIMATATDGGTTNISSIREQEGKSVLLKATCNTGYVFDGWYAADTLYTIMPNFSYTVGKEDVSFVARFRFDPDSPKEPNAPSTAKYSSIYLMNIIGKPGDTVDYPVYLNALVPLNDMSFQLTFDPMLKPKLDEIKMSAKANGYTVSCTAVNDTVFVFSLIGGKVPVTNTPLVTFSVLIPDTAATGRGYPVKINQVSAGLDNGSTTTTSTRNGRVSVYKLGDTNGDDVVNIFDQINLITNVLGNETDVFIKEVSNVNDDDNIDIQDAIGVVEIITQ